MFNYTIMAEKQNIRVVGGGIVLNKEGKIFLARGTKFEDKYILPGGGMEFGESLGDGAKREIKEETGMDVEVVGHLSFSELLKYGKGHYKDKHYVICDFILQFNGDDNDINLNEEYSGEYDWFTVDEAFKLNLGGNCEQPLLKYKEYIESKECLDNWKRAVAEFENYKKSKMNVEKDMAGRAVEEFAYKLLPVLDNFHMSTEHIPEDQKGGAWVQGILHIQKQIEQVLTEMDVVEIEAREGDAFDPSVHEAVQSREQGTGNREQEEKKNAKKNSRDTIKNVMMRGYKRGERVIRPARVTVSSE